MKTLLSPTLRPLLPAVLAMAISSCVSVVPPPQKTSHLEITLPKDWRGMYEVKVDDSTSTETNAAVEAAIIRYYAQMPYGPRVTQVIIPDWGVREASPGKIVLEGYPNLVSSPHVAVEPLNIRIPGKSVTEFDEVVLTLKFED